MKPVRAYSVIIMILIISMMCQAGSIWAKKGPAGKSTYADDKAIQVGDVLTIIISEIHKVDNKVKAVQSKSSSDSLTFDGNANFIENVIPNLPSVGIEAESSRSMDGKSDYKDERKIEDRVTVIVEDIHPNGNLVVVGTRMRDLSGDKQTIQVSGIVRPSDISYDNTIQSEQIANFQMVATSEGPSKNYNTPGWLSKFVGWLWPF